MPDPAPAPTWRALRASAAAITASAARIADDARSGDARAAVVDVEVEAARTRFSERSPAFDRIRRAVVAAAADARRARASLARTLRRIGVRVPRRSVREWLASAHDEIAYRVATLSDAIDRRNRRSP